MWSWTYYGSTRKHMETLISWVVILIALLLGAATLLQVRGTGSQLFGSAESSFRVRRGFERTLFRGTIVLAIALAAVSVISVRING